MNTNLVNHPMVVGDPERMIRDDESGEPIYPRCHDSFIECTCPKPWSSVETDGFQIRVEGKKIMAYPIQDTYREEMLWITGTLHQLLCGLCGKTLEANEILNEIEADEIVEAFFEIHRLCYRLET